MFKDLRINTESINLAEINTDIEVKSSFLLTNNNLPFSSEVNTENINCVNSNNNLSILQIIQEEQNDMTLSSNSSSLSSSPSLTSITPRPLRSIVSINKPAFEYPIILNSNEADKLKNNMLNQYVIQNKLQNHQ